ncbi:rhomboid family intramembrane serine protease [Agrobacterium sp. a22-2]|uniref:rhomboid family intramembrane serine protease n=1 Tax=Agrobacterium sp. a22-2 TaxID=2283840 RepID=UPI001447F1ED|nr:rhomboid family intramembrane serine protease [Agrobacterium sp. a22-2]NKN37800.1 rhomboid family intramembrane serine protease [Agrobacterium sp. a22-2]
MNAIPEPPEGEDRPVNDEPPRRPDREPVFNLPTGILVSLLLLAGIYAAQSLLFDAATEEWFVTTLGFSPVRYVYPLSEQGFEWLWTPVTYSLLHGGIEHLVFNSLWLAAFGTPVYRRIGATRFVLFWIASSAAGALLHALVNWGQPTLMIGASAVVSALMGAACRFAFAGGRQIRRHDMGFQVRRLSVFEALGDRTIQVFVGAWLFGNIAIAVGVPLFGDLSQAVAWDAHIGGFVFGFLLFALFDRPARSFTP